MGMPRACLSESQLTQPKVTLAEGSQMLGRGRQTILCPTGTDPPCHRLPKGALALTPLLPGAATEFPVQAPSLAALSPPAGVLLPGPHYPSPSPGRPVAM